MATVHLAFDPRFRRQVAVKVLPDRFLNHPVLRKRFEREAQTIASLEHPAIVPVYDFGEQDGLLYMVMRYMPGGSLESRLRLGALPLSTTAAIITRLAQALDTVHARGIIHRDLKPANILFDAYDNAYISDFGIVHLTEATTALTGEGLIGTPAYMSPEQVRGDGQIDARSDLYSLGIIVFEMLTGRQPYQAATPMATAMQHLTQPVPRLNTYRSSIPPAMDTLIQTAMSKDPGARFPTAEELAAQLNTAAQSTGEMAPGAFNTPQAASQAPTLVETINEKDDSSPDLPVPSPKAMLEAAQTTGSSHPTSGAQAAPPVPQAAVPHKTQTYQPWLLGGSIGLLVICGAIIVGYLLFSRFLPRLPGASAPSQTARPLTEQPSAVNPVPEQVVTQPPETAQPVFEDSFVDPASGWPTGSNEIGAYGYEAGAYRITISQPGELFWVTPARQASDAFFEVSAAFAGGSSENYFGLVCRLQDANNFYYFVISSSGQYTLGKYEQGVFDPFLAQGWASSPLIRKDQNANQLRAGCTGDQLTFSINGELLQEVRDQTFTQGEYGLIAAALAEPRTEIIFDDFKAYAP
jgi:serine/threonine protein kinase